MRRTSIATSRPTARRASTTARSLEKTLPESTEDGCVRLAGKRERVRGFGE